MLDELLQKANSATNCDSIEQTTLTGPRMETFKETLSTYKTTPILQV